MNRWLWCQVVIRPYREGKNVMKRIVIVGLPVENKATDQMELAPDSDGYATIEGSRIRSMSHLPGEIAVIEFTDGMVLIPWALFNRLLTRAMKGRPVMEA